MQTIAEVIAQLDHIVAHSVAQSSRQAYFASLYRQMTVAVQQGIQQQVFEDAARMEKLDVLFAQRYIDAWQQYQQHGTLTQSWHHVFDSTQQPYTVIQHLLMGINTHINLDLAIAAALTAPGESIWQLQKDFDTINSQIATLAVEVQRKLEAICWPMKLLSRISEGKEKAVLNFSIEKARQAAWANAVALALMPEQERAAYIVQMDATVLGISQKIAKPGAVAGWMLTPIRWFEEKNVQRVAALLA